MRYKALFCKIPILIFDLLQKLAFLLLLIILKSITPIKPYYGVWRVVVKVAVGGGDLSD